MAQNDKEKIQLAHGGGGRLTDELIDHVILKHLPRPAALLDSALVATGGSPVAFTTDSYVVSPLFFPGGDVGRLAVCGTCNDLAMVGAEPMALSLALIIEEGFDIETLDRVMQSLAETARAAKVAIVTGDTKVVAHGQADGLYLNTAGIGRVLPGARIGFERVADGDQILLSGTLGDHGLAIMVERERLAVHTPITSDVACIADLANGLVRELGDSVKFLRDPTRAGLAGTLVDLATNARHDLLIREASLPALPAVRTAAEVLGLDLLTVANEGKFVAVVDRGASSEALSICRRHPLGHSAAIIGEVQKAAAGRVVLETSIGGHRLVQKPYGEQLPRIC